MEWAGILGADGSALFNAKGQVLAIPNRMTLALMRAVDRWVERD